MLLLFLALIHGLSLASAEQQHPIISSNKLNVAGRNPFSYCNSQDPYTLQIDHIHLTPQDPADWKPGNNITIEIDGHNQQVIENGAVLDIRIMKRDRGGIWRLLTFKKMDLCAELRSTIGDDCPVLTGVSTEIRNFTLPPDTPRGSYHLVLDAHTRFEERITCLHAAVTF